jgi:putative Holliday junction resolvase
MRFVGVDFGRRRIGLATSDATGMLAKAWRMVPGGATPAASADVVAPLVRALVAEDDGVEAVVIGLPKRLDGSESDQTPAVRAFGDALGRLVDCPIAFQDERLTSVEAESRLAEREPDWRKRKQMIDAEAAAIILQDFLDARARHRAAGDHPEPRHEW